MIFYFLCGFSFLFVLLLMKKWQEFLARNLSDQKGSLARNLSNQNAFSARNLSNEIKFDIFKCLNFKGLTVIQKTNRFLNQFVEDYRNDLVLQNVYNFELVHKLVIKREEYGYIEVDVELVLEDFSLSDELKNKWEYAISVHIPLYLSYNEPCKAVIRINRVDRLLLRLPYYPKNIKEMLIIRSWLKRLSNCIFNDATFDNIIFNPALIKLLFENDGNLPQFHAKKTLLRYPIILFEDQAMNFVKYHLVVCKEFSVDFTLVTNLEQCNGTILNILKEGNIFPYVKIIFKVAPSFFELIKDHLKTSTNCSNIASKFDFAVDNRNHALNYVNLRNMADETNDCIYSGEYLYNSKFRIVNDNNPNIIFLASYMFRGDNNYTIKFNFKRK